VNLPSGVSAIGVSCGNSHTACVMSNGDVYTFGYNDFGQLGDGTTINRNIPTKVNLPLGVSAIGVSCGGNHTACVMSNGDVYTFGYNYDGQLGDETTKERNNPTKVNLLSSAIGLYCGYSHTACVMTNGDVYTFGYNGYGQLGDGTTTERNIPTKVNLPSGVSAIGVSCGAYHTACIMSNGDVYTFGNNWYGQLGDGTNNCRIIPTKVNLPLSAIGVSCGGFYTTCVMSNGDVYTFGDNHNGQLGDGTKIDSNIPTKVNLPSGVSAIGVSCGNNHTACVMSNGDVYTFGNNYNGQLGDGTNNDSNNPTKVNLPSSAIGVSCGGNHTACVMSNGDVYTFGNNEFGQLGDGTNTDRNNPTKVNLPSS
jgi:alpha-tubulin suppressor-like RCC1 family protein